MSASSGAASGLSQCACTNISLMQLFHELKQQFPGVPDHVVSNTIATHCHDKTACQSRLQSEAEASLTRAFLSAARKDRKDIDVTVRCPNQVINKATDQADESAQPFDDAKATIVSPIDNITEKINENLESVQNTDSAPEQSCEIIPPLNKVLEPEHDLLKSISSGSSTSSSNDSDEEFDYSDSQSYQILKSNKVKSDLNKKLVTKADSNNVSNPTQNNQNGKPERPCTLEFVKGNSHFTGFNLKPNELLTQIVNEAFPVENNSHQKRTEEKKTNTEHAGNWDSPGFNVSVNLNCRMDLPHSRNSGDFEEESRLRRGYTSVNLTVCTPTSSTASPAGEVGDQQRGFEGRVTVTVNPSLVSSMAAIPTRRAPPPPSRRAPPPPNHPPLLVNDNTDLSGASPEPMTQIESLRCRQRARLLRMRQALAAEKTRLITAAREAALLSAPLPPPRAARRLRTTVSALRQSCQRLAAAIDQRPTNSGIPTQAYNPPPITDLDEDFYNNLYTGQRVQHTSSQPSDPVLHTDEFPPWVCHLCTFRNEGQLNKCEVCDMPRIVVGTDRMCESLDSGIATLSIHNGISLAPRPALQTSSNITHSAC